MEEHKGEEAANKPGIARVNHCVAVASSMIFVQIARQVIKVCAEKGA